MNTPRFFIERRGDQIRLIFPVAQRYEVNVYPITKRRKYSRMEPKYTPWKTIAIGKLTARELGMALKKNQLDGHIDFVANDNWRMEVYAGNGDINEN